MSFRRRRSTFRKRRRAVKAGRSDARTICVYGRVSPIPSHPVLSINVILNVAHETFFCGALRLRYTVCCPSSPLPHQMCRHRNRALRQRQRQLLDQRRHHRRRRRRPSLQRCRSSLMLASSRVEMTVGKICSSAHICAGHRQWLKSAAIALVERSHMSICACHVLTDFPSIFCFGLPISPHIFFVFILVSWIPQDVI
jgi:hypothetical protein